MSKQYNILISVFSFLLVILIYGSSLTGRPLWDDNFFIFDRYASSQSTHLFFWKHAIWPFFESTTLILYKVFGQNTTYWHVVNFSLHIINGVLLGYIAKKFKPSLAIPLTLVFWIHPLCTLTVAWIIQLKTLLSLFFSLTAAILLLKKNNSKLTYALSCLIFACSIATKSSTIMIPFLALLFCTFKANWRSHIPKILPFILISFAGLVRMSTHDDLNVTIKNSEATISSTFAHSDPETFEVEDLATISSNETIERIPEIADQDTPSSESIDNSKDETNTQPIVSETGVSNIGSEEPIQNIENTKPELIAEIEAPTKLKIIAFTTSYYLAAPWLPYDLSPIHSSYRGGFGFKNYFGFFILVVSIILVLFKINWPFILICSQLILLAPFIGLIIAPYMAFSIVSEQHLYIVMPFMILTQLMLLSKISPHYFKASFLVLFFLLSCLTARYSPSFKNEESIFSRILEVYPTDRLASLNLANYYYKLGRTKQAVFVLRRALDLAEEHPYLKQDKLHDFIQRSYEKMMVLDSI